MIRNLLIKTRSLVSNPFTGVTRSFASIVERLFVLFVFLNVSISVVFCNCLDKQNSIATYEEVKNLPNHPEVLLIDVRETQELKDTGAIPTSINIPLASLKEALTSDRAKSEFKGKYGRKFPELDDEIIFTCQAGRRAQTAVDQACQLGFKNSRNYKGSWLEWAEKEGLKSS